MVQLRVAYWLRLAQYFINVIFLSLVHYDWLRAVVINHFKIFKKSTHLFE